MSTMSLKKAVIAAVMIAPLALTATACGKDDSAKKPAATTTATATSTTATSSEESTTQSPTSSSEETSTDQTSTEESTASSTEEASSTESSTEAPMPTTSAAAPAPATVAKSTAAKAPMKGNPASPAQVEEFKRVVKAVMPQADRKAMMINVLKYTCSSLMQKQMGPQFNRTQMLNMMQQLPPEVMQQALQSVAQANASIPTTAPELEKVSDAVVNGTNGYATMVFKGKNGKPISTKQHFVREDGIWRICE